MNKTKKINDNMAKLRTLSNKYFSVNRQTTEAIFQTIPSGNNICDTVLGGERKKNIHKNTKKEEFT